VPFEPARCRPRAVVQEYVVLDDVAGAGCRRTAGRRPSSRDGTPAARGWRPAACAGCVASGCRSVMMPGAEIPDLEAGDLEVARVHTAVRRCAATGIGGRSCRRPGRTGRRQAEDPAWAEAVHDHRGCRCRTRPGCGPGRRSRQLRCGFETSSPAAGGASTICTCRDRHCFSGSPSGSVPSPPSSPAWSTVRRCAHPDCGGSSPVPQAASASNGCRVQVSVLVDVASIRFRAHCSTDGPAKRRTACPKKRPRALDARPS